MATTRNRRAGVEDRWTRADGAPSARHGAGLRWMGRYVDDEGKERTKSFARKVDARAWLDEQSAALTMGTWVDPTRASITFSTYFEQWAEAKVWRTPGSRAAAEQAAASVTFGSVPMARLDETHLQAWVRAMVDDGLAANTVNARVGQVRGVLRQAMRGRRRVLAFDPTDGLSLPEAPKRLRIPTPDEVRHLLGAAPAQYRAAVALGAFAGTRDGEARGMRVSDVLFLQREVNIARQAGRSYDGVRDDEAAPKRGSARTIAVSQRLTDLLAVHVAEQLTGEGPDRWLFPGRGDAPISASSMNRHWATARSGLDWPMHFHDLRHFFASGLIAAGCDVKTVQMALGHKSAALTLDTYGHLWPDAKDRARAAGDTLVGQVLDAPKAPSREAAAD